MRLLRVDRLDQLDESLQFADSVRNTPVVIDYRVAKEENVFPMIPSGKSYSDLILAKDQMA